jgi:hypothetical protein
MYKALSISPHFFTNRVLQIESIGFLASLEMQFRAFVIATLATLAAATPTRRTSSPGTVCCDSLTSASDPAAAAILNSIGVDVSDIDPLVGLTCTDVTVIGGAATWQV